MQTAAFPMLLFAACLLGLAIALLVAGNLFNPGRQSRVKQMPYESGMDPIHDTRRRFDVRFHLMAIAFLVFDVELLFLYPWAVAIGPAGHAPPGRVEQGSAGVPPVTVTAAQTAVVVQPGAAPGSTGQTSPVFLGGIVFLALLTLGYAYEWRKGVFRWR